MGNTFTNRATRRIVRAVRTVENTPLHLRHKRRGKLGPGSSTPPTFVRLTGNQVLRSLNIAVGGGSSVSVDVAWTYSGTEAAPNTATGVTADVSGGLTFTASNPVGHTSSPPLFNIAEFNATTSVVMGIEMNTANYPPATRPRPAGGGGTTNTHKYDRLVEVKTMLNSSGALIYYFDSGTWHDGGCVV